MASRKLKSKNGITIEVWCKTFRVEGTHMVLPTGGMASDDQIIECVDAIYDTCKTEMANSVRAFLKI